MNFDKVQFVYVDISYLKKIKVTKKNLEDYEKELAEYYENNK